MTPKIEPHPDAPIFIHEQFGGFVKGAVYDKDRNALVPTGWFWIGKYKGWTLHKFNWQKRIDAAGKFRTRETKTKPADKKESAP